MLREILAEFDRVDAPLDLTELSARLNIQKSALQGMMTTLVRQGKLKMDGTAGSSLGRIPVIVFIVWDVQPPRIALSSEKCRHPIQ